MSNPTFTEKIELLLGDIAVLEEDAEKKSSQAAEKRIELADALQAAGLDGYKSPVANVVNRITRSVKIADEAATVAALSHEDAAYLTTRTVVSDRFKADVLEGKISQPGVQVVERVSLQIRFAKS